jgi:hypothetical protein
MRIRVKSMFSRLIWAAIAWFPSRPLPRAPRHGEAFEPISAARPMFRLA